MTDEMTQPTQNQPHDFRLLAVGQGLSWLGNGFQAVALAVAVVMTGGGPGDLGLVMACSVLAMLGGSLFGGVWADRLQPQRVMFLSDIVRFVSVTMMALMFGTGHRWIPVLCVLAAVTGVAGSFFSPAMTALKPMVVTREQRQSANATLGLLQTTCTVLGPAAGGVTVATLGTAAGFLVNAVSFLASAATVLFIRARIERSPRGRMLREMGQGWTEIRRRDWLLSGVLAAAIYHVANGIVLVLILVVAIQDLGGANAAGLIASAEGIGGVVGAAIAMRYRPVRLLRAGWLALLLMPFWVLAFVWPGVLPAILIGAVLGYSGLSFFSVAWDTALQDHVPHRLLARVSSWDMLTSFIAMPVGNILAGPLMHAFGLDRVLIGCALVLSGSSVATLLVPGTRRLTRQSVPPDAPVQVGEAKT